MRTNKNLLLLIALAMLSLTYSSCSNSNDDIDSPTPVPPTSNDVTIKKVPVSYGGEETGVVGIRYYDDLPGIAYISVADFQKMMLPGSTMTVQKTDEGIYQLSNGKGTATVNTNNETFTSDDFMAFTNLMDLLRPGMDNVYYDGAPFIRYSRMELTPATAVVCFDFKKYGIDLRADENGVYFPFATISDLYTDLYYHVAAFNGERVFIITDTANSDIVDIDPDFTKEALSHSTRSAEQAAYSYAELCFVIDHFYGMPGRSSLEAGIQSVGLDATLDASETGRAVKRLLKSTNLFDTIYGMNILSVLLDDGGHTSMAIGLILERTDNESIISFIQEKMASYPTTYLELDEIFATWFLKAMQKYKVGQLRTEQRDLALPDGDPFYRKQGDTAFCLFDQFGPTNFTAWNDYYAGEASMPTVDKDYQGDLTVVLDALNRANNDPEVKNLVIDLSCNPGGSLDIVLTITSLIANESKFYSDNTLTGQHQVIYYEVDRNFDRKFDAADQDVHYDLNVAILTSNTSFSCGNLLPSLMKDLGYPILGERSGGGACAVQNLCTPDGLQYQISSYRGRLTNKTWQSIDAGIEPNIPITVGTTTEGDPSYADFYNISSLRTLINGWFSN